MESEKIKLVKNDKFAIFTGIRLKKVESGYAEVELEIGENHKNGVGMVHGGVLFTLADYAFAAASNSDGFATVAVNAAISFMKSPKGTVITAVAQEISSGRKLCTYNIDVFDTDKEPVARVLATGYIKERKT